MFRKILIIFIIIILFVSFADKAGADFLRLILFYDQGKIGFGSIDINGAGLENIRYIKGLNFVEPPEGDYLVAVQSFKGVILHRFKTSLKPTICHDSIDPETQKMTGGCEELERGITGLDIPYYPNIQMANIFDTSGKLVFSADLSSFATCNENNICEANENLSNCPQDCSPLQPKKEKHWFWIIFGVFIAGFGIGIYLYRKRKEKITSMYE